MDISKRTLKALIATSVILLLNKLYQIYQALYQIYQAFRFIPEEAAGIGIIGGADGPTAIFTTSKLLPQLLLPLLSFLLEIFLCLYVLIKSVKAIKKT